jgi:hypothetical protein
VIWGGHVVIITPFRANAIDFRPVIDNPAPGPSKTGQITARTISINGADEAEPRQRVPVTARQQATNRRHVQGSAARSAICATAGRSERALRVCISMHANARQVWLHCR